MSGANTPWGGSSSELPLVGLTSAQALFRPLSPDFTPPPAALAPPDLGSPHTGRVQGCLYASLRPFPTPSRPAPHVPAHPGFRLAPSPAPVPGAGHLPAQLAQVLAASAPAPPRARATRQLPAGPARSTQAPRSQSAAATLRPERGWGVGTSGCRSARAKTRERRQRVRGRWPGFRSPHRVPTLLGRPHLTSPPCASAA